MDITEIILTQCKQGIPDAQRQLYSTILPYLRAIAGRYLKDESYSKDVLQESFVKIFRSLDNYDSKKGLFKTWAARILINTCLNYNSRVIGEPTEEIGEQTNELSVNYSDYSEFSDEHLLVILKQMPNKYYNVFNLAIIEGFSHQEIADMLQISAMSSRKQLSRGRKWLQNFFRNEPQFKSYLKAL